LTKNQEGEIVMSDRSHHGDDKNQKPKRKMKNYTLLRRHTQIDNTPATGHGDFPQVTWKPVQTIVAESPAKARAAFKKTFGNHIVFSGKFAPYLIEEK
jgi:hypothetical protein